MILIYKRREWSNIKKEADTWEPVVQEGEERVAALVTDGIAFLSHNLYEISTGTLFQWGLSNSQSQRVSIPLIYSYYNQMAPEWVELSSRDSKTTLGKETMLRTNFQNDTLK